MNNEQLLYSYGLAIYMESKAKILHDLKDQIHINKAAINEANIEALLIAISSMILNKDDILNK